MNELPQEFKNYTPPSWDEWFMKQVYLVAQKSKDPSTKIGAVLVKDKHVISSGFNGFPVGVNDLPERYNERELKYKLVVHAETNSVLSAARFGISTYNTILYTNTYPCHDCMKSLLQGGIKEIVIHKQWPDMTHSQWIESTKISKMMIQEAGIKIRELDVILNVNGYLNGKIINI